MGTATRLLSFFFESYGKRRPEVAQDRDHNNWPRTALYLQSPPTPPEKKGQRGGESNAEVMGSERKSKEEEKRKRKRISDYGSEDEGKSKRRTSVKDTETKSSKSEKKDKIKRKKKSHTSSKHHSEKGKKSKEKQKSKRDKHDGQSILKLQVLSADDYFSKNNEFATWLKEEKKVFFSDLSSESARDLFLQFIEEWNSQKLKSRYYEGIETGTRTAHKWKIKQ